MKGKAKIGVAEAGEGEEPQKKKTSGEAKAEQRAKMNAMADEALQEGGLALPIPQTEAQSLQMKVGARFVNMSHAQ